MDEIEKFTYERFSNKDKAEFMKTKVLREETSLRQRTDTILQSEKALELVLENQRYFAQYQDKISMKAKKQREEIALKSVKEVNDLISQRKNLQIEAYRLT